MIQNNLAPVLCETGSFSSVSIAREFATASPNPLAPCCMNTLSILWGTEPGHWELWPHCPCFFPAPTSLPTCSSGYSFHLVGSWARTGSCVYTAAVSPCLQFQLERAQPQLGSPPAPAPQPEGEAGRSKASNTALYCLAALPYCPPEIATTT